MLQRLKSSLKETLKTLLMITPMLLAIMGLIGLFKAYVTPQMLKTLFTGATFHNVLG